jgi:hypothetical protein
MTDRLYRSARHPAELLDRWLLAEGTRHTQLPSAGARNSAAKAALVLSAH